MPLNKSRPSMSLPSKCAASTPGCRKGSATISSGSPGNSHGDDTTISTTPPTSADGERSRRPNQPRVVGAAIRLAGASALVSASVETSSLIAESLSDKSSSSGKTNARIETGIDKVHHPVHHDHDDGTAQQDAEQQIEITLEQCLKRQPSQARPRKHGLHQHGAADDGADLHTQHGDQR